MKKPYDISQKLRDLKHSYLTILYKKYFRKSPENCLYNQPYVFVGEGGKEYEIRLCLLHQKNLNLDAGIDPTLIDVCQESSICNKCNAFIFRYTKDGIKKNFEEELENINIRAKKYPDICALMWVLEKTEDKPLNVFSRILLKISTQIRTLKDK